jgi:hypothetical protein
MMTYALHSTFIFILSKYPNALTLHMYVCLMYSMLSVSPVWCMCIYTYISITYIQLTAFSTANVFFSVSTSLNLESILLTLMLRLCYTIYKDTPTHIYSTINSKVPYAQYCIRNRIMYIRTYSENVRKFTKRTRRLQRF